CQHYKSLPFSF
nr:immunoglobulin light chain junction region [Macaca mulatta]